MRSERDVIAFGLDVFYQFEARVPEFDAVFNVQCTLHGGGGLRVKFWDLSLE